MHTPTLSTHRERGHQLQRLPHHGDLLADARGAADRPQPPARRQRHHRRARGGLGRLHRRDSQDLGDHGRGAARTTATRPAAFGKWHITPATETARRWARSTAGRPGCGFDYFYGFLAGETSASASRDSSRRTPASIERARGHDEKLPPARRHDGQGDRLAAQAVRAYAPDKPFFMYCAPGAAHAPHHVAKEWADKYKGKFDDGWDAYRERDLRAPEEARAGSRRTPKLTPRADACAAWDTHPGRREAALRAARWRSSPASSEHADWQRRHA
ncbi:MAG: sulfatase-like hydrolase/transferase [Desulfobacterales bacterium]|nr:sulfatase-like hydrolase/transferase [Desulfobacterales bacterium]